MASPSALIWDDDRYYLAAYSDYWDKIVTYRVDRMCDVEVVDENAVKDDSFNPSEYARLMDPGDMGRNVGIRLVYRMARDVSYQNLLGLNVLTMAI